MTTRLEDLDAALKKIKELGAEKPPFKEEALEAVLLLDLLRDVLGYANKTSTDGSATSAALRQQPFKDSLGHIIPDIILLKLAAPPGEESKNVFVEIKRYGAFKSDTEQKKALRQAARYSIKEGHDYGIVTDGVRWTYYVYVVTYSARSSKRKVIRRIVEFDLNSEESAKLGRLILERSRGKELLTLLAVLTRLHKTVTPDDLKNIAKLKTINPRIELAWNDQDGKALPAKEKPLLRLLYGKDNLRLAGQTGSSQIESFCGLTLADFCDEILPLH